jgi:hypothetical protein
MLHRNEIQKLFQWLSEKAHVYWSKPQHRELFSLSFSRNPSLIALKQCWIIEGFLVVNARHSESIATVVTINCLIFGYFLCKTQIYLKPNKDLNHIRICFHRLFSESIFKVHWSNAELVWVGWSSTPDIVNQWQRVSRSTACYFGAYCDFQSALKQCWTGLGWLVVNAWHCESMATGVMLNCLQFWCLLCKTHNYLLKLNKKIGVDRPSGLHFIFALPLSKTPV